MVKALSDWTLVYDLDGTLVDSAPDLHAALNHTLATLGLGPVDLSLIRQMIGDGAKALIKKGLAEHHAPIHAEQIDNDLWPVFIDYYTHNATQLSQVFPGARACLESFRDAGLTQVVCTNKPEALAQIVLRDLSLESFFTALSGGDTYPYRKPDGRHILRLLDQAGGQPDKAVMIGDSHTDEAAAHNAGLPFIFVRFGYGQLSHIHTPHTLSIDHWKALPDALERLAG